MSYKVLGLIDLYNNPELGKLTENRPLASTSFLGRYSFIDIPLSNFLNSNVDNIQILCQKHIRSLSKHIGSGRNWVRNTKLGQCSILFDEPNALKKGYSNDVNCIFENYSQVDEVHADYVIISEPYMVFECNYQKILEKHIASQQRISMLYTHVKKGLKTGYLSQKKLLIEDNKVTHIDKNKGDLDSGDIFLSSMVLDYPMFISLLDYAKKTSAFFNIDDVITYLLDTQSSNISINAIDIENNVLCIDSIQSYISNSLGLLNQTNFKSIFKDDWPIKTASYDTPPTKYKKDANVTNCFVSNGCEIYGNVTNSILGRNVYIGKNTTVKDSIIFSSSIIDDNVNLSYAIVDKEAVIKHKKSVIGSLEDPIYINRGERI